MMFSSTHNIPSVCAAYTFALERVMNGTAALIASEYEVDIGMILVIGFIFYNHTTVIM
jgi:hypothetical protein